MEKKIETEMETREYIGVILSGCKDSYFVGSPPISIADSWCSVFIVTLCPAHWKSHGTPTKRIKKNDPLGPPSQC